VNTLSKKQPRVLLINPPHKYKGQALGFNVYFPLSLLYVAATTKDICDVKIFDCLIEDFEAVEVGGFVTYGTPIEKVRVAIEDYAPDIVGISIPFSSQSENGLRISALCRDIDPEITVVLGGPHPSVRYAKLLDDGDCDFCVVGEGEVTFREFIERFGAGESLENIEGVAHKTNGKVEYTKRRPLDDLDELPLPAYDLLNLDDYLNNPNLYKSRSAIPTKSVSIITSRGCPFNCVFCSIKLHMGKKFRFHSPEYVLRHFKYCVEEMGITNFHLEDDNISFKPLRFEAILDGIIDAKMDIQWDTPNGIRADSLNYRIVEKIKKSGCAGVQLAIESGNQKVLDTIVKKDTILEKVIEIVGYCAELKINMCAFYIMGFPGETMSDMRETVELAVRLFKDYKVVPIMLFATPLYGTELYDVAVEHNMIDENISDEDYLTATQYYGEPLIATKEFSAEDLKSLAREFEARINEHSGSNSLRQILNDKQSFFEEMQSS
jgi:magnesium-protoporphyrin IX monomethyl ester (oxidative) cyclase